MTAHADQDKSNIVRNGGSTRPEVCFEKPIHAKKEGNGQPSAKQCHSTEVAMLFAPSKSSH